MDEIKKGHPLRGVSVYSYSGEYGVSMDLEDCFMDMQDMGATCVEILANGHIDDYPNPSDAWVDNWHRLCSEYGIVPGEYGHWIDSRLYKGRTSTAKEQYEMLLQDIKLANRLGFTVLRTKIGVIDDECTPVENWREIIRMALPAAEDYNVRMQPEVHQPTPLNHPWIMDYVDFIEQTQTKYFGMNIDFGVFQNKFPPEMYQRFAVNGVVDMEYLKETMGIGTNISKPEDIIPLLPYIFCCHAKFNIMTEDFQEATIPYEEILNVMVDHGWNGFLVSEYEGPHKDEPGYVSEQLKRQHIMMKRILGY